MRIAVIGAGHVGGLEMSRYLEPLAVLWVLAFRTRRPGSDLAYRLIDRDQGKEI